MSADKQFLHASRIHGTASDVLVRLYHRTRQHSGKAIAVSDKENAARSARLIARELLIRGIRV